MTKNTNKSSINVKLVRDKTGLTNIELAELIGCSTQWLTNQEKSKELTLSIKHLYKLSKVSKIPMNKLIK
jgi:transcriptional regulator with XRE-family HTH domain